MKLKAGDEVGDRTVINVKPKDDMITFGIPEGDTRNCGAYVTDYREWVRYEIELEMSAKGKS